MIYYKQCLLLKGPSEGLYWIPESFAKQDKFLELEIDKGIWDNGWQVKVVYKVARLSEKELLDRSQDYKRTRDASDI